ncbi:lysophospholipase [Litorimonas taeanensis]|uniref:Lysophospholipase n=2 Tax=Litorimonas taeanensis TaxID=568099 RepID=A0A420WFA6_9PROT|nr:lysophospholipase [Litorimonas taeanensis]
MMQSVVPPFDAAEIIQPGGRPLPTGLDERAKTYFVPTKDGITLRVLLAQPETKSPRGTIIFSPGRTEFIEKYWETIHDLTARGFCVFMVDPRGQGLSDRVLPDKLKSYIDSFQTYADDLSDMTKQFDAYLPRPHIAMGHSMGGTIVLQSILSGVLAPSAVICSAPMLGLFDLETPLMRWVIAGLAKVGLGEKNLPFQSQRNGMPVSFTANKLTTDKDRYKIWSSYFLSVPRLRVGQPTFGWISAALSSMAYVNRNAENLRVPGLLVAAGADPIVDPSSVEEFAKNAGVAYDVIPGALHELFLEKDAYRNHFLALIDKFLEEQAL